jgi:DNA-binding transcriptional LysR family regulator
MPRLEQMVRGEDFAPARSQEIFRVAMSDHAAMVVLPSLLASVRRAATLIKLEVFPSGAETYGDVAAGGIDTFLCPEEAPPSLEPETLFTLDFVCLVGAGLPVRGRRLTLKQYLGFQHVLVEIRKANKLWWIAPSHNMAPSGTSRLVCRSLCQRSSPSHKPT